MADAQAEQAAPVAAPAASDRIWCHDEGRSLVTRMARWRCKGQVVSAEDAERIKQERVDQLPILPAMGLQYEF